MGQIGPPVTPKRTPFNESRSCYSHLAGLAGVAVRQNLVTQGFILIEGSNYVCTVKLLEQFGSLGWPKPTPAEQSGKQCLDCTERKYHIGGKLGSYLLQRALNCSWLRRTETPRVLEIAQTNNFLFVPRALPAELTGIDEKVVCDTL